MPDRFVWIRRLRRAAFLMLAATSMGVAVGMIWIAVSPGMVRVTPTVAFVGILALLILPGVTIAAWAWDKSIHLQTVRAIRNAQQDYDDEAPSDSPTATRPNLRSAAVVVETKSVEVEPAEPVMTRHNAGRTRPERPASPRL